MQLFSSPLFINQPGLPAFLALRGTTLSYWTSDEQWMCVTEREGDGTKLRKKGKKTVCRCSRRPDRGQLALRPVNWETERAPLYWHQHASHTDGWDTAAALFSECVHAASQLWLGKPRGVTHHTQGGIRLEVRGEARPLLGEMKVRKQSSLASLDSL